MSRIGKKPIIIPQGVEVSIAGNKVSVKGPKGSLEVDVLPVVKVVQSDGQLNFTIDNQEDKKEKALWGLFRNLVNNAILGVSNGFEKTLEINGVGFKVAMQGQDLLLNVGFSHPVVYKPIAGVTIATEKNVIKVSGISKQAVGQTAAEIRAIKKPEPYKGKGIKYSDEVIRRKAGKVVKS